MVNARNANLDSAISIASYVIHQLNNEEFNIEEWLSLYDYYEQAIEKWKQPNRKTLVHDYIEAVYLEEQNYLLRKHESEEVIKELKELLDNYEIDYSIIGNASIDASDDVEAYADEAAEKVLDIAISN